MLQMIFSPPGCGKTYEIHQQILARYENGADNMILMVPEQISFETEKDMLHLLTAGGMDAVQVLSFSRFADKFFEKFGGRSKKAIDDMGKSALMQLAVKRLSGSLDIFAKQLSSPAFSDELIRLNTQMKRFCVSTGALLNQADKENGILAKKLHEISLIMAEYDALCDNEYYDPLDDLSKIAVLLNDDRYFANKAVFLDSFNGFTPQQFPIIEKIISQADDVYITLTLDKNADCEGLALYKNMMDTAKRIRELAKKCGVKIAPDITLDGYKRYENDEMKAVAKYAFRADKLKFEQTCSNVQTAVLQNIYDECDFVASNIRKLTREQGLRYRDIAVIARDTEKYSGIIEQTFAQYQIPCFIDAKKNANGTAIVHFMINALKAAEYFDTENILAMLKTGISFADENDVMLLDSYCAVWDVDGSDWQSDFLGSVNGIDETHDEKDAQKLVQINSLRGQLMIPLEKLHNAAKSGGAKRISAALYQFMLDMQANVRLNEFCQQLDKEGNPGESDVQRQAYEIVIRLLDQLVMSVDDYEIDFHRYCELFINSMNCADIGKLPQGLDEITVGSAERMRPKSPKVTFIIGACEGEFPSVFSGGGLFSDNELISLKDSGIELSCYDEQRAVDEIFLAYSAMCSPSERLFVSCYLADSKNNVINPSAIMTELSDIFGIKPKTDFQNDIDYVECENAALRLLAREWQTNSQTKSNLYRYFDENHNPEFLQMLHSNDKKDSNIDSAVARKLYGENIYLSASKIDTFYHCAFHYFCRYGLKIMPSKTAQIDYLQRGTLIHLCLCNFVGKITAEQYKSMTKQQILDEIYSITDEVIHTFLSAKKADNIQKYALDSLCISLCDMLDVIYDEIIMTDFKVLKTELSFGMGEFDDYKALEFLQNDGSKIYITGQIDRVDTFEKDGESYVRIIDYKTGKLDFKLSDVIYGQNLQMLLYLYAYRAAHKKYDNADCTPSGVLYMRVQNKPALNIRKVRTKEEIMQQKRKDMKMNGFLLDDEVSLCAMEPSLEGTFTPIREKKGEISADSSYSLQQYEKLAVHMKRLVLQMGELLHEGKIEINPLNGVKNACDYCDYSGICSRDMNEKCDNIDSIKDSEAMEIIEQAGEESEHK